MCPCTLFEVGPVVAAVDQRHGRLDAGVQLPRIQPGGPVSEDRVLGPSVALPASSAHELVEQGVGQARRIALARALLRRARVLMLDEPTAGVDPESEAAIIDVLRGVDATVIVVGHRSAINDIADHTVAVGVVV